MLTKLHDAPAGVLADAILFEAIRLPPLDAARVNRTKFFKGDFGPFQTPVQLETFSGDKFTWS